MAFRACPDLALIFTFHHFPFVEKVGQPLADPPLLAGTKCGRLTSIAGVGLPALQAAPKEIFTFMAYSPCQMSILYQTEPRDTSPVWYFFLPYGAAIALSNGIAVNH